MLIIKPCRLLDRPVIRHRLAAAVENERCQLFHIPPLRNEVRPKGEGKKS